MYTVPFGPSLQGGFMADNELHDTRRNIPFKPSEYAAIKDHVEKTGKKFTTFVRIAAVKAASGEIALDDEKIKGVPVAGTVHAGTLEECREEDGREVVCSEHPNGDAYKYLEIEGNCMNKQVPHGALALFREQGYTFGQTIAVMVDCKMMLRVYEYDPKYKCIRLDCDSYEDGHKSYLIRADDPKSDKHFWIKPENALVRGVYTGDYIVKRKNK